MKLGRRGFLGSMLGGAVAAPSLAKEAVASALTGPDMTLAGLGWVPFGGRDPIGGPVNATDSDNWAAQRLAQLVGRTAQAHEHYRRTTPVHALDGDLIASRSFSLAAKIRMQRNRNYDRRMREDADYFGGIVAGWLE